MVGNLIEEKDTEIKTRDNCIEEPLQQLTLLYI